VEIGLIVYFLCVFWVLLFGHHRRLKRSRVIVKLNEKSPYDGFPTKLLVLRFILLILFLVTVAKDQSSNVLSICNN